jgi:succinate-semialdehyde dehydrogenase/glutarate-semialdehyde dehydrogenase
VIRKEPIGPLLGIMPWNFPYYQVARFAGPNLMAGNTIILKHAPQDPESALAMEQIFRDAGLPEDAYINIFASNGQVADIIADPRVAGVSVTGSERAGAAVAEVAGRNLKKVVLELGGSDPFIVLDSDDIAKTVKDAVAGRMGNAGQACTAAKRMIVVGDLYDEFTDQFTAAMAALRPGDPADPASDLGPMSSEGAAERLMEQITDAVDKGATLRTGGKRLDRPGAFVEPTVLTDVTPQMRALPRGAVRARGGDLPGRGRRRSGGAGQFLVVRARRRGLQRGPRASPGGRRSARHRHGVDQQPDGLDGRLAVRRDQALRRRPGTGHPRHR